MHKIEWWGEGGKGEGVGRKTAGSKATSQTIRLMHHCPNELVHDCSNTTIHDLPYVNKDK